MRKIFYLSFILALALGISGCGVKDDTVKYRLTFNDSIFESEKTEYAAGENVTVRYDIIATDTDYHFYSDDVEFEQSFDGGYVFTFTMPEHDVTLNAESRNSMEYDPGMAEGDVVRTYEATEADLCEEYLAEDRLVTMVRYYELSDGTWKTDDHEYKYRLEITGRMSGAVKDSTFVYLSNIEEIPFERAYMAAGLSSSTEDYFDPAEAVLVEMK
ncbi:MAG: cupredoxin domain-containing protein [Lachnospiraceae bacterium]|nr:cupredoxin domain-containing protein [Lachnospiraceae bacterium]